MLQLSHQTVHNELLPACVMEDVGGWNQLLGLCDVLYWNNTARNGQTKEGLLFCLFFPPSSSCLPFFLITPWSRANQEVKWQKEICFVKSFSQHHKVANKASRELRDNTLITSIWCCIRLETQLQTPWKLRLSLVPTKMSEKLKVLETLCWIEKLYSFLIHSTNIYWKQVFITGSAGWLR